MNWRHYTFLFFVGLLVPFAVSRFQSLPGYMDADYYFAGGIQLATGKGFNEPYIWNYLSDPQSLPNPSHTYWMPLASMISAIGMWMAGQTTYAAGRAPFIFLSACVPLWTAALAFDISRNRLLALVSGLLSIFSMYYSPFMPVPDNYGIYMILGATFLLCVPRNQKWIPLVLGVLAGLLSLSRSDGLLWLGLAGLTVMWKFAHPADGSGITIKQWVPLIVPAGSLAILGYLVVMGPWHYRNLILFDSFMTPGGGRLLWLQNYNETFIYPPEALTREGFLEAGWAAAIQDRMSALSSNLGNTFAAQGEIFLFPFILMGLVNLQRDVRAKLAMVGWIILFIVMTFIFPFAGSRGSFFHAGAAFQPMWWVAAPIGLESMIAWARGRAWFKDRAAPVFLHGMLVMLAVIMTGYLVNFRVIATGWAKDDVIYPSVEEMLVENGINSSDVVIVRNPPGYFIASGRSSISLPYGDESTILTVAKKYNAGYLVLEEGGTFDGIDDLYDHPHDHSSFSYLGEVNGARLFHIELTR